MSHIFEIDRGGKWRRPTGEGEVSRRNAVIGGDFVTFLAEHEQEGGSIRFNARDFMLRKRYTDEQRSFFTNLLDMYIHKVLRRMPRDDEE